MAQDCTKAREGEEKERRRKAQRATEAGRGGGILALTYFTLGGLYIYTQWDSNRCLRASLNSQGRHARHSASHSDEIILL